MQSLEIPSASYFKLDTFEFSDFDLSDDETVLASFVIFQELEFLNSMHIRKDVRISTLIRVNHIDDESFSPLSSTLILYFLDVYMISI